MHLTPRQLRHRNNRKAIEYAGEIQRLRLEGFTLEAIREALSDVGVVVSVATVRREAIRSPVGHRPAATSAVASRLDIKAATAGQSEKAAVDGPGRSSREIAAAFFESRELNPFVRRNQR